MKKLLMALIFSSALQANAQSIGNSNCYQLYETGGLYPIVCLDGIYYEMGLFKMSIVGPNSTIVRSCTTHNAMRGDLVLGEESLEVYSSNGDQLQIRMESSEEDFSEGKVIFPSGTELKFLKLNEQETNSILSTVYSSGACD
ncbi:MAG: hypothetical protein ACPGJV_08390 [Bacteriovoracaceae bacterium]